MKENFWCHSRTVARTYCTLRNEIVIKAYLWNSWGMWNVECGMWNVGEVELEICLHLFVISPPIVFCGLW